MNKKKVLISYYEMIVGGSTTSLLAFLSCIDKSKYDVDLQLYRNRGPLLSSVPEGVHVLPPAAQYDSKVGRLIKVAKSLLRGALVKARRANKKAGKKGLSGQVLVEFQAKHLSKKSKKHYDIAIGYMEGWSDKYIAFNVSASQKLGWLHSTFANIAAIPALEKPWMEKVDKLVFVADNCKEAFCDTMPEFSHKAVTVLNITDSRTIRARAEQEDLADNDYLSFKNSDCFKLVTVCRVDISTKGLDRSLLCAKKLKEAGKRFLWVVVGGGPSLETFRDMIRAEGLEEHVKAVGNRMNPLPFVKQADLYCMLSRYEGKPMTVTESMILGTPPFVTEYLSAHEQIQDGTDGFIIENGDDTAAEPLLNLINDPSRLKEAKDYLLSREYGNSEYMREIEEKYL